MMYCKKFKDLEGCSKCKINLSDSKNIRHLTPTSMMQVVDIIFNFCINNSTKRIVLHISTIDCKGNIDILYTESQNENYTRRNRLTCKKFINSWYEYNKILLYQALIIIYLCRVSYILNSVASDNEIERQAIQLNEIMNELDN